jgi:uncharacterized membrane protein YkoI
MGCYPIHPPFSSVSLLAIPGLEKVDVRGSFVLVMVALLGLGNQATAGTRATGFNETDVLQQALDQPAELDQFDQLAQQEADSGIPPSEAAAIARDQVPGAKVVGVKLLSNGWYAVTLRAKGSVTRVLVNAQDGSVR